MQINQEMFEHAIIELLRSKAVLSPRRELILRNIPNAQLVTVRGEGRDDYEIWIPELETVLDDGLIEMAFVDATFYVGGPPTDHSTMSRIDVRMDIVEKRPLFS